MVTRPTYAHHDMSRKAEATRAHEVRPLHSPEKPPDAMKTSLEIAKDVLYALLNATDVLYALVSATDVLYALVSCNGRTLCPSLNTVFVAEFSIN
jgi:hypothetical protein